MVQMAYTAMQAHMSVNNVINDILIMVNGLLNKGTNFFNTGHMNNR